MMLTISVAKTVRIPLAVEFLLWVIFKVYLRFAPKFEKGHIFFGVTPETLGRLCLSAAYKVQRPS